MKKKTELQVGQIWGVLPLEKTLEVRVIFEYAPYENWHNKAFDNMAYRDIGGEAFGIRESIFRSWITRKKAEKIGHYNFKTGKAKAKGEKR